MALLNLFQAVITGSGVVVSMERQRNDTYRASWTFGKGERYNTTTCYYTEKQVQDWLIKGYMFIVNPASIAEEYEDKNKSSLPATFFFTTASGTRYTAYVHDYFVTVAWGEGIRTETQEFAIRNVENLVATGEWIILPETYRSPASVAAEFMNYMEQHEGPLSVDDRVAIAQTLVLLDKVMYG
jgi:hypothetical protein